MHYTAQEGFSPTDLFSIASRFARRDSVTDIAEFGKGHINKTFLVTTSAGTKIHFILQRVNTRVFRKPKLVMRNMSVATLHMRDRMRHAPPPEGRRWEVPSVLLTEEDCYFWIASDGSFWRAVQFIEGCRSHPVVRDSAHAREVGYALGFFHVLLSDLPLSGLADTLPGFHITPHYLKHYDAVIEGHHRAASPEVNHCLRFVDKHRGAAYVLEEAKSKGRLLIHAIHGDPKTDNIMMDDRTGQAVSIIDLDTVKPGLLHYDIGDCLRSACNPAGEDTGQGGNVRFETDIAMAVLTGYRSVARVILTDNDFDFLYDAIFLLAFELGLRFFTDYLEGNVYFRTSRPDHNLDRALVQFGLAESIESRKVTIRNIIRDMR
jgi:Ser/Thr protein kinase RdoA (MazF antagonist)